MATTPDADKPSVSNVEENRARLCEEFSELAGSDSAVAQCHLAENEWQMEKALNPVVEADLEKVFETQLSLTAENSPKTGNSPKRGKGPRPKRRTAEGKPPAACPSSSSSHKLSEYDDKRLSLISWNVDGLDEDNLGERARGLCSYLALYTPDLVFLQELIPPYVQYLKKRAVSYLIIEGGEEGYFTGMMLNKSRIKLVESEIVPYPTTKMMRNLLVAQVTFKGQKLCLMTSHLESCKDHAAERMKQLQVVMQRMRDAPDDVTVLFGGDTNLRDTEVAKVGLPSSVCDVWERLGKREHCRYTWNTEINSNKEAPYIARCRFDRVYLRPATKDGVPHLAPDNMALLGLEKLDCGRFTSDHWGIYCTITA